jgi:hypothetical protein
MASSGGDPSRSRDPKRTEIRKKIDDLTKIADGLEKGVTDGSQQFKELQSNARDLRRIFEEVDNELGEREILDVPGHVKDKVNWVKARTRLHEAYHVARSYLEQKATPDEGIKLAPFEPRKLEVAKPQSKTKKDDGAGTGKGRDEPPSNENDEQGKVPSVIGIHWSEVPTDVAALTKFLGRKEVVFQKKMNDVNEARDRPTKMAHVRILQCCINQAGKYEYAVNNLLPEEMKSDEEEALLETWDAFRKDLDEAVTLVDPYSAKLPKTEEEGHQKKGLAFQGQGRGAP